MHNELERIVVIKGRESKDVRAQFMLLNRLYGTNCKIRLCTRSVVTFYDYIDLYYACLGPVLVQRIGNYSKCCISL